MSRSLAGTIARITDHGGGTSRSPSEVRFSLSEPSTRTLSEESGKGQETSKATKAVVEEESTRSGVIFLAA